MTITTCTNDQCSEYGITKTASWDIPAEMPIICGACGAETTRQPEAEAEDQPS
jgi:hypothetical protein